LTVHNEHIKELESLILRIAHPSGNKTGGKFAASTNLHSTLKQAITAYDADRRATLIGGKVQIQRRKAKIAKGKGIKGLIDLKGDAVRL
jgi:hypothetical protein